MRPQRSSAATAEIESERRILSTEGLLIGSHVITPRLGYNHHGIYVGDGKVVQYGGLVRGLRTGPVEEVPLMKFTRGAPLWERLETSLHFDRNEIVRRARSRIGEDRYQLLSNNCEHFCEWCLHGKARSYQIEGWWLTKLVLLLKLLSGSAATLLVTPGTRRA
jgi:Lecithin retinol acyltransferase